MQKLPRRVFGSFFFSLSTMAAKPFECAQSIGSLSDGRSLVRTACEVEPVQLGEGESASQWINIAPVSPFVEARDGRTFQVSDALKIAAASELPLLIDRDHESEGFFGGTEAFGWVEELRVQLEDEGEFPRAGIWGRAEWTDDGHDLVKRKKYRFLSPVLLIDEKSRDVESIVSVALTNRPALHLEALSAFRAKCSQQFGQLRTEDQGMKPETIKALFAALGLADGATDEQVLEAFNAKIKPQQTGVSAEAFTALQNQFNAAQTEIVSLKSKLEEADKAAFSAEVKSVLDEAVKAGKVPPAAREGYEKVCKDRAGLELFKTQILPNLVAIGEPAPQSEPAKPSKGNEAFRAQLKARGFTDEQIDAAVKLPVNGRSAADSED